MDHTFVIPAFGNSPYLVECLASLKRQRGSKSRLAIATSTPSDEIARLAKEEGVPLHVNPDRAGIGNDWNFALTVAGTRFVTLAHQDDLYREDYVERIREALHGVPDLLMAFSDYDEIDTSGPRAPHANLRVKRFLTRRAFAGQTSIATRRDKRRLLAWGNPVCCPSVILDRSRLASFRFDETMRSNLDWEAWLRLADEPGPFVYIDQPLVIRRIHPASETTALIADTRRVAEDRAMFRRIWPAPIAETIAAVYRASYLANRI